ncbi:MAG: hypothetical protein Q7S50_01760 [bacterium]|nr:hypothetical protein [bacterium]
MDRFSLRPRSRLDTAYDPERDGRIEAEGDPDVISAVIQQAQNVREGREDPNIRVALLIDPGGNSGVYGGGEITAIHEAGLTNGFKVIAGNSTGAHLGAWLLSGDPRLGTTIYSEECTTSDFIRLKRIPDGYGMDVEFISQLYRGEVGNKRLNVENIKHSRPDFLIIAVKYETGKSALLNGKEGDIIRKIQASSAVPSLYTIPVEIDGMRYSDGSPAARDALQDILKRYDPTHILILTNSPKNTPQDRLTRLGDTLLSRRLPGPLRSAWLSRDKNLKERDELLEKCGKPHLFLRADKVVGTLTIDSGKISAAAARAEEHMRQQIDSARKLRA